MPRNNLPRPAMHLHDAGVCYPNAWRLVDQFRAARGVDLPHWDDWCFLPMAAAYSIVAAGNGVSRINSLGIAADIARLAALAAWRVTQGIYRIDPALLPRLWETPVSGDIPIDVLLHGFPQWCLYVETPESEEMVGFFAHLEWDVERKRPELRLLIDRPDGRLVPIPLHLGAQSLVECVQQAVDQAIGFAAGYHLDVPPNTAASIAALIEPCVSVLLYICSQCDQIDGNPTNPQPKRVKGGWRTFPPSKTTTYHVGTAIGAALRAAYQQQEIAAGGYSVRPHVRRAHWHTYWVGSGMDKKAVLRWLSPILVNSTRPA